MALHINADGRSAGFFVKELATLPDQDEVVIAISDQRYAPLVEALNFGNIRAELIEKVAEWHPDEAVTLQDYAKQQGDNGRLGTPYMAADPALVAHYLQQLEEWTADQDGVLRVPVTVNFAKANTDGNATQTAAEKIEYAKTVQSVDYNLLTGAFRESQDKLAKAGTKVQYVPVAMQHSFGGINPEAQYDAAALAYPDVDPVSYFTNPDGNRLDLNQDFIGMVAAYEAIEQFSAKGNLAYSAGVASTNQHQQMSVQDSKCHTVVPIIALLPRSSNPTEGGKLWVEKLGPNYDQVHVLQSRAEGDWTGTQQELADKLTRLVKERCR